MRTEGIELLGVIVVPALVALVALSLRRQPLVQAVIAAFAILAQNVLLTLVADGQYRVFGLDLRIGVVERLFITGAGIPVAVAVLYHARIAEEGRKFVGVALTVSAAVATTALVVSNLAAALALLVASVAVAVGLVDEALRPVEPTPGLAPLPPVRPFAAALRYLSLSVFAAIALGFGLILLDRYSISPDQSGLLKVTFAFLVVGLALRLGAAPFHLWLPSLVDPARGSGLVGMVTLGGLSGVTVLFGAHLLLNHPPLLLQNEFGRTAGSAGALGSAVLGGLLAIGQGERRRRAFAYLFISDAGLILFGLVSGTANGMTAALALALGYCLTVPLALVSFNLLDSGSILARAGLLLAGLSVIGLAPTYGFAARWLLYTAAAQLGVGWLIAALAAVMLMIVAAMRSFAPLLLNPTRPQPTPLYGGGGVIGVAPLDRLFALIIVLLGLLIIVLGLYPAPILNTIGAWVGARGFLP